MSRNWSRIALLLIAFTGILHSVQAAVNIQQSVTGLEVSEATIKGGMDLYKAKCSACHALDRRMAGPALGGVHERREIDWLIKWIRNNQELRDAGDADAIAIYNEFNGAAMNAFTDLSDDQIKSIIMYIENGGYTEAAPEPAASGEQAAETVDPKLVKRVNYLLVLIGLLIIAIVGLIIRNIDMVSKLTRKPMFKANDNNAKMMLIFLLGGMALALYELKIHGKYVLLGDSSSLHGAQLDKMMIITFIITGFVFFVTQILLFWFAYKYRAKKDVKALFYPENDKLELLWTIIPAVVLTILVIGGLNAWRSIMKEPAANTAKIEVFAYQFGWSARYPGTDGELGNANYNLISGSNPLGVAVKEEATLLLAELRNDIANYESSIANLPSELGKLKGSVGGLTGKDEKLIRKQIEQIENGEKESELRLQIRRRQTQIRRIEEALAEESFFTPASMDDVVTDEIHLVVNEPVTLKFRGRDVIHSALLKEFRAQMNVVPGLPTQFTFTPSKTTVARRMELNDPTFDYHIVCNKICGNSHFNMKLKVVVEDRAAYKSWINSKQGTFVKKAEEKTQEQQPAEVAGDIALN